MKRSSERRLDGKIPARIKYTFAFGALGKDMIYGMIATFSMIYFTDIIKVNPVFIGAMFFVAKLWDAFNDLFMGMIVENIEITSISLDFRQAVNDAVNYLFNLGHKDIGFLGGIEKLEDGTVYPDKRLSAFENACENKGINYKNYILQDKFTTASGYSMMKELIESERVPSAIFAASDPIAIGAMRALQENGYKIPEDVSIIGFDNTELSGYTNPPLTTMNAPVYAMGIYGIEVINTMLHSKNNKLLSPMKIYMPCPIKIRNSCGKPQQ